MPPGSRAGGRLGGDRRPWGGQTSMGGTDVPCWPTVLESVQLWSGAGSSGRVAVQGPQQVFMLCCVFFFTEFIWATLVNTIT